MNSSVSESRAASLLHWGDTEQQSLFISYKNDQSKHEKWQKDFQ